MQVLPSKPLSHLIKHYLFVESSTKNIKKFRLFPDGNTGIVFSFYNKLISGHSSFNKIDYLPDSFVYGQIKNFKDIFCFNETSLLIIVFHPQGLHQLLGIPANEMIDEIIDLRELFGLAGEEVTYKLFESQGLEDRIKIIESFLSQLLKELIPIPYFIEKEILYIDEYILLYVFLKDNEQEKFEYDNPEHEKRSIISQFVPGLIAEYLNKLDIDLVVEGYQIVYRLQYEETIDYFRQILSEQELQEILDYMDVEIELNIYTCINIDGCLN